jgi:hypothetical protein
LSHQREGERKKESGDSSVNGICVCGSPARCCQPAVAGGFIYADLRSELNTYLALKLCLLRVLLGLTATATSFPLSKHTGGGDTAPAFSGWHVYLQFTWEVGLPRLLWSFPPSAAFTRFPTPGCWAQAPAPAFSDRLVYLQFCEGLPLPLRCSGHPALFATCLFCCYCLLFSFFFFFPWVGVGLSRGLC